MGAIISGLLNILQWLAATFANLAGWLVSTVQAVAGWFIRVLQWVTTTLWNFIVDVVHWALNALFWLLGHLVELPLILLSTLVNFLPDMPQEWFNLVDGSVTIPALSIANQILPVSEALSVIFLWLTFYGVMTTWRIITFIRGGK